MLKRSLILGTCLTIICLAFGPAHADERRITIGTAGTAGALYPMGVAMAGAIDRHAKGFKATAEASSASLENIRNLSSGQVDWAISQNEVAFLAFHGKGKYKGRPASGLRSLFGTIISWAQIFAPANSPIKTVRDFKGKRIGVGAPGSGGERAASKILAFYGLDYKSVKAEFMTNTEMVSALKDGALDAFIITHPLRSAALLDLTTSFKVKMIPIADQGFYQEHPYFTKRFVKPGVYKGVDAEVATPTSRIVMYTGTKAGLDEDAVYTLLKALWEHLGEWSGTHPAVAKYTTLKDALKGLAVPLHPGAIKYYREAGLKVPAGLIP